jgi:hypothetical protein
MPKMTFFGSDLVRSLLLGFMLGSAAMVITLGADDARAAAAPSAAHQGLGR